jgi:hypothetical protein
MKNFFSKLVHHGHELGAIYYAWSLLAGSGGAAYGLYKWAADQDYAKYYLLAFLVIAIVLVVTIPIFLFMLVKQGVAEEKRPAANQDIKLVSKVAQYEIGPTHMKKKQCLKLVALEANVHRYLFSLTTSGTASPTVSLVNCKTATLDGPFSRRNADVYQVTFDAPLAKDQEVELEIDVDISDPGQTMRRYVSDTFSSCGEYGSFKGEYVFTQKPQAVHSEVDVGDTGASLGPIQALHPVSGKYHLAAKSVVHRSSYSVSWIW